jgi:glycosyltransferase involved in cell wall biosynthesis
MTPSAQPPLFCIIIPTRNRPEEFATALQSVLAQSCRDLEVVVVDDGSDDDARSRYALVEHAAPPNVRFLRLMQRARGHGHCFARNHGIEVARGTFVGFLDDDDCWADPQYLERAKAEILHHGADVYFANQSAFTHDGREVHGLWLNRLGSLLPDTLRQRRKVYPVTIEQLMKVRGFAHMNCWLVRRSLFIEAGGMDENLRYEPDLDIYMRVIDRAGTILHDEHVVARHQVPDPSRKSNASTANGQLQRLLFQLMVAEKHLIGLHHPVLLERTRERKGHILKRLAEALAKDGEYRHASHYARLGLVTLPTFGWLVKTAWLSVRAVVSPGAQSGAHR